MESLLGLIFAWLFISLRWVHTYNHLTYNHILNRMLTFWAAFICVMALWVNLLIHNITDIIASLCREVDNMSDRALLNLLFLFYRGAPIQYGVIILYSAYKIAE